jgi:predicted RNA-binding Zn ribbon-like protein
MTDKFKNLQFDGGALAFDFINTLNCWNKPATTDYLESFEDLLKWSSLTKMLSSGQIMILREWQQKHTSNTKKELTKLINLRSNLQALFSAIANNTTPSDKIAGCFNKSLADLFKYTKIIFQSNSAVVLVRNQKNPLPEPYLIILKSAYDIITSENFSRIKECPGCGWIFLDKTKNGKRRWCNMHVCGNNNKASRFYYKQKKETV